MKAQNIRTASMLLAAAVTIGSVSLPVQASGSTGISSVLPSAGVSLTVNNKSTTLSSVKSVGNSSSTAEIVDTLDIKTIEDTQEPLASEPELTKQEAEAKAEEARFKSLGIAQVNYYVNVRDLPSEQG